MKILWMNTIIGLMIEKKYNEKLYTKGRSQHIFYPSKHFYLF